MVWKLIIVKNKGLDVGILGQESFILLELCSILSHNNFCITVLGNVKTGFRGVGSVDARGDGVGENGSDECNEPLRSIGANDVDAGPLCHFQSEQSFSELAYVLVVVLPSPLHPQSVSLDLHGFPLSFVLNVTLEELWYCEWLQGSWPFSTLHMDGKLCENISGPVYIPSLGVA